MAPSRERIADELLKLLGLGDPSATVEIMLERNILKPVLPEIERARLPRLKALIAAEQEAAIDPDPLRRLAALLPSDAALAEDIAARLRLSNKARRRLACASATELFRRREELGYRAGIECAVDRLLLAGRTADAAALAAWKAPRLPIGGGALIARGLPEGPIVAHTLRQIEDAWVDSGFPGGDELERIVGAALERNKP